MNERLKDLMAKANFGNVENGEVTFDPRLEVFAKFIVSECVKVVENISPGYDDYRNQIEDAFRNDCIEEIKQTFGVEE